MKVKLILPALTEATSPFFRPIKYSLFPPLGLATLAGYLDPGDEVDIQDEHVERLDLDDDPDLVVIQVYITSAGRAYRIADHYRRKGAHVALGGLHVTSLPDEAAQHADTVFLGPGEDTWPAFLQDFRRGHPAARYQSRTRTLAEIDRLPGRHLYFLDDHLFGDQRFASALFSGMRGASRLWQAAGTVSSVLRPKLVEQAVACGLRSLFVGFETLNPANLREQRKYQNLNRDYNEAIARLHDLGVMINGSFVFGLDADDESVFERTVEWAVTQGIETATFHILTPYPGTALHRRLADQNRILTADWDRYDTRHAVFQPARLSVDALERGYHRAYRDFYRWRSIAHGASAHDRMLDSMRHFGYAAGWKKFEPMWDWVIRAKRVGAMLPALELILSGTPVRRQSSPPASDRGCSSAAADADARPARQAERLAM
jgi:radical SAM superfamily enzyme YgiQ (UPF0313 family)